MDKFRMWRRCLTEWKFPMATQQELFRADAIVTQAVSRMKDGSAGHGNLLLALHVRRMQQVFFKQELGRELPVIPQGEVVLAMPDLPGVVAVADGSPDGKSTLLWNTYTVAAFQAEICKQHGWRTVIVVTFDLHMGRALWTYRSLGLDPLPGPVIGRGYTHRKLVHWGMRAKWRVFLRELALRHVFLLLGKFG